MEATRIENFSGVQSGNIRVTTINPLDTLVRVEALFAGQIEKVIFKESSIAFQGDSKVLALGLFFGAGRAPCKLLCLVFIVCRTVELA